MDRKQKIEQIIRSIQKAEDTGREISKEKLIAVSCLEWGNTRRTILEYISLIELTRKNKIRWMKKGVKNEM